MKLALNTINPSPILFPYFSIPIPCGHALSIEQDSEWLNLLEYLGYKTGVINFFRATGPSMEGSHITDGDMLVGRKTNFARAGEVVIANINGEATVKRLKSHAHGLYLVPANDDYPIRKVH